MKATVLCSAVLLSLTLGSEPVRAGAWTQKKGAYYLKLSLNRFSTQKQFSFTGVRQPLNAQLTNLSESKFSDTNLGVYAEYGIADWFTGLLTTSYKSYTSSGFNSSDELRFENTTNGISDLFVGGRLQLVGQPYALALQTMIKLPSGDADAEIPLGTGSTDAELRLQFGSKLPISIQNYFTADLGYNVRGGRTFNDEIPYFAEFGIFPAKTLIVKAAVDGRKSTESFTSQASMVGDPTQNTLIIDQDFTRLWGGLIYSLSPTMQLSLEVSTVLTGKNTLAGQAVYLGMAFTPP